jgi:hypothetical protein
MVLYQRSRNAMTRVRAMGKFEDAIAEVHVTIVLAYTESRSFSSWYTGARIDSTTYHTMPPRLNVTTLARSIPLRTRPQFQLPARPATRFAPAQCRVYSDSQTSGANDRSKKVDAKPEDHVSEEAAKTAKIMGEEGPDLSRGTPVEDVGNGSTNGKRNWN